MTCPDDGAGRTGTTTRGPFWWKPFGPTNYGAIGTASTKGLPNTYMAFSSSHKSALRKNKPRSKRPIPSTILHGKVTIFQENVHRPSNETIIKAAMSPRIDVQFINSGENLSLIRPLFRCVSLLRCKWNLSVVYKDTGH